MKIIEDKYSQDLRTWKHSCTCSYCLSVLEVDGTDLTIRTTKRSDRYDTSWTIEVLEYVCVLCKHKNQLEFPFDFPKWLRLRLTENGK
jgi:hypothetical protein